MLNLSEGELGLIDGKPIVRWEVRFITMEGWHKTFAEARANAKEINQPPETIATACVAVAEDGTWEPK